jgi:hypothetical protein
MKTIAQWAKIRPIFSPNLVTLNMAEEALGNLATSYIKSEFVSKHFN